MISCHRATELLSEAMEHKLSARQKFTLMLHLMVCKGCRVFRAHIHLLRKTSRAPIQENEAVLSVATRERIKAWIERVDETEQ